MPLGPKGSDSTCAVSHVSVVAPLRHKDPLLDLDRLEHDISHFKELGINTVRIYTIDNNKNHDRAMAMLDNAGIYLALDVNTPAYSSNRESPAALHASYIDVYLRSLFVTIDSFAGYSTCNPVLKINKKGWTPPDSHHVTRLRRQPSSVFLRERGDQCAEKKVKPLLK